MEMDMDMHTSAQHELGVVCSYKYVEEAAVEGLDGVPPRGERELAVEHA